jgi:16S rRNA (guanine527-N7)-methyltransferase
MTEDAQTRLADRLDQLVAEVGLNPLQAKQNKQLILYLSLLLRWNARTNLTAVRDPDAILERHFLEALACAQHLPSGIATVLDFGSGAGLPGIPIALYRPEVTVTLAESQNKKAAFLREVVRVTGISARVYSARAEALTETFDCVTLRAVDRMEQAVLTASRLVAPGGWLALLITRTNLPALQAAAAGRFSWSHGGVGPLPGSEKRILALGKRRSESV